MSDATKGPVKELNEYQKAALETARHDPRLGYLYPLLGLVGETAEVAEKIVAELWGKDGPADGLETYLYVNLTRAIEAGKRVEALKKLLRDGLSDIPAGDLAGLAKKIEESGPASVEADQAIGKELGDVMWYHAVLADYLCWELDEVANLNIKKLRDRKDRGVLKGSGDDR